MKYIISILLILSSIACSSTRTLNMAINSNQNDCIEKSSFKSARSISNDLNKQFTYRKKYLSEIQNLLAKYPNDTLILKENYDYICIGCPSDYVAVYVDSLLVIYRLEIPQTEYKKQKISISNTYHDKDGYFYDDFSELMQEIRLNSRWNQNPEKFGTDYCFDGGHTIYSVFFPSGKIESMYMRCWIPKEIRDKEKK